MAKVTVEQVRKACKEKNLKLVNRDWFSVSYEYEEKGTGCVGECCPLGALFFKSTEDNYETLEKRAVKKFGRYFVEGFIAGVDGQSRLIEADNPQHLKHYIQGANEGRRMRKYLKLN